MSGWKAACGVGCILALWAVYVVGAGSLLSLLVSPTPAAPNPAPREQKRRAHCSEGYIVDTVVCGGKLYNVSNGRMEFMGEADSPSGRKPNYVPQG